MYGEPTFYVPRQRKCLKRNSSSKSSRKHHSLSTNGQYISTPITKQNSIQSNSCNVSGVSTTSSVSSVSTYKSTRTLSRLSTYSLVTPSTESPCTKLSPLAKVSSVSTGSSSPDTPESARCSIRLTKGSSASPSAFNHQISGIHHRLAKISSSNSNYNASPPPFKRPRGGNSPRASKGGGGGSSGTDSQSHSLQSLQDFQGFVCQHHRSTSSQIKDFKDGSIASSGGVSGMKSMNRREYSFSKKTLEKPPVEGMTPLSTTMSTMGTMGTIRTMGTIGTMGTIPTLSHEVSTDSYTNTIGTQYTMTSTDINVSARASVTYTNSYLSQRERSVSPSLMSFLTVRQRSAGSSTASVRSGVSR